MHSNKCLHAAHSICCLTPHTLALHQRLQSHETPKSVEISPNQIAPKCSLNFDGCTFFRGIGRIIGLCKTHNLGNSMSSCSCCLCSSCCCNCHCRCMTTLFLFGHDQWFLMFILYLLAYPQWFVYPDIFLWGGSFMMSEASKTTSHLLLPLVFCVGFLFSTECPFQGTETRSLLIHSQTITLRQISDMLATERPGGQGN